MSRRYFDDDWKQSWTKKPRRKRRVRLLPTLLMIVGAVTLLVLAARYVIVPLLVQLGGVL